MLRLVFALRKESSSDCSNAFVIIHRYPCRFSARFAGEVGMTRARSSHLFEPIHEARSKRACVLVPSAENVTVLLSVNISG